MRSNGSQETGYTFQFIQHFSKLRLVKFEAETFLTFKFIFCCNFCLKKYQKNKASSEVDVKKEKDQVLFYWSFIYRSSTIGTIRLHQFFIFLDKSWAYTCRIYFSKLIHKQFTFYRLQRRSCPTKNVLNKTQTNIVIIGDYDTQICRPEDLRVGCFRICQ